MGKRHRKKQVGVEKQEENPQGADLRESISADNGNSVPVLLRSVFGQTYTSDRTNALPTDLRLIDAEGFRVNVQVPVPIRSDDPVPSEYPWVGFLSGGIVYRQSSTLNQINTLSLDLRRVYPEAFGVNPQLPLPPAPLKSDVLPSAGRVILWQAPDPKPSHDNSEDNSSEDLASSIQEVESDGG